MRLCFLVEEHYRHDGMPIEVIRQLTSWGHQVDVLRPGGSLLRMTEAVRAGTHDAWVLKTVSGGPGLTLLEAAASAGMTTVNDARSIRGVRDKALAAAIGRSRGLPLPPTYAAARPELLAEIPASEYPLVVKPADGSSGRAVHLVSSPDRLAAMVPELAREGMLIAQPYVPNSGIDVKVYCVGGELYATERCSPLHPDRSVRGTPRAAVGRGGRDSRPGRGGLRPRSVRRGRAAGTGRPGGRRRERLPELPSGPGRGGAGGTSRARAGPRWRGVRRGRPPSARPPAARAVGGRRCTPPARAGAAPVQVPAAGGESA